MNKSSSSTTEPVSLGIDSPALHPFPEGIGSAAVEGLQRVVHVARRAQSAGGVAGAERWIPEEDRCGDLGARWAMEDRSFNGKTIGKL